MNHKERNIIYISYLIYYICLGFAGFYSYKNQIGEIYMIPISIFTCLLLPLLFKLFKLKIIFEICLINLVFVFIANVLGSILGFYSIYYFDKFLHFISGILLCELSYMMFCFLKQNINNQKEQILCILFINAFHMMIALFWEFFEYGCLIFLNNDAIHHYSSGVHDAMGDMLVALLGGFIVTFSVLHYFKYKKENIWVRINKKFYKINFSS